MKNIIFILAFFPLFIYGQNQATYEQTSENSFHTTEMDTLYLNSDWNITPWLVYIWDIDSLSPESKPVIMVLGQREFINKLYSVKSRIIKTYAILEVPVNLYDRKLTSKK